jgi:Holliday junction resolvasome RuvABC DNA-binding subunit
LEDLLRFIKKNGFDALGKLHGVGKRSCEDLYLILKDKDILTSKDTCYLFRYILI